MPRDPKRNNASGFYIKGKRCAVYKLDSEFLGRTSPFDVDAAPLGQLRRAFVSIFQLGRPVRFIRSGTESCGDCMFRNLAKVD